MKSALPPNLEAKYKFIAGRQMAAVALLRAGVAGGLFAVLILTSFLAPVLGRDRIGWVFIGVLGPLFVAEIYGFFRLAKYGDDLCRVTGFVCPHCDKPLYLPRGRIQLTGTCPLCGKLVDPRRERPSLKTSLPDDPDVVIGNELLLVGTRVRFVRTLTESANRDHPEIYYAEPGESGEITGHRNAETYWVVAEGRQNRFTVWSDDFEVIRANS